MRKQWIALVAVCLLFVGCDVSTEENATADDEDQIESVIQLPQSYQQDYDNKSDYEKGKELGEKLSEELEGIDWEENYDKARDAGQEAADWLNKLLD